MLLLKTGEFGTRFQEKPQISATPADQHLAIGLSCMTVNVFDERAVGTSERRSLYNTTQLPPPQLHFDALAREIVGIRGLVAERKAGWRTPARRPGLTTALFTGNCLG